MKIAKRKFYYIPGLDGNLGKKRKYNEFKKLLQKQNEDITYLTWDANDLNIVQNLTEEIIKTSDNEDQIILIASSTGCNFAEQIDNELYTKHDYFSTYLIYINPLINLDVILNPQSKLLNIASLKNQIKDVITSINDTLIFIGTEDKVLNSDNQQKFLKLNNQIEYFNDDHGLSKTPTSELFDYVLEYIYYNV